MPNPPFLRLELAALRERVCFALSSQAGAHTFDLYFPHLPLDLRELGYFCEFIIDNIASVASTLLIARSPYCGNKRFPGIFYALALWEAASSSTGIYSLPALESATHSYGQPYPQTLGSWDEFCGKLAKGKWGNFLILGFPIDTEPGAFVALSNTSFVASFPFPIIHLRGSFLRKQMSSQ